ncbi:MAG: cation diffusion facilitator family transporter [Eggerthellaceae bacterium]|jgi:cation diffusion facilitator family transporter|nr:cation diffusion facilitator family transporter [Eggerthellaceae bacterium]MCH4221651.1 cation diffusion facilitator family transporter [Eggerthellaceae bacterium]
MAAIVTDRQNGSHRTRSIKHVLLLVFFLNIVVALSKYFYGLATGSTSMRADGIHSIFDSLGNIVGIVGIMLAARPADEDHPYGHSKFETYASLIIGIMLLCAAFEVGGSAVMKLLSGNYSAQVTPMSFVIMIATLCINLCVTKYEHKQGTQLHSDVLLADASHTLSDAFVSLGVIIGLVLVEFGFDAADPIMALIVTVAILYTAWDVFHRGLETLSDHARIPEEDIYACVCGISGVDGAHKIRTRGTEGEVYVDLHVVVDPSMTVVAAHDLSTSVENTLRQAFPSVCEVLVHIEPDDGSHDL